MNFGKGYYKSFEQGVEREWVTTNGLGSYAGGSIIGANARKHHGYLIASLRPPVERQVILANVYETLVIKDTAHCTQSARRPQCIDSGHDYLQRFGYDSYPIFTYQIQGTFIKKSIVLQRNKNTVAVRYEVINGDYNSHLALTPLYNYRDHNDRSERADLLFTTIGERNEIHMVPKSTPSTAIHSYCSEGQFIQREEDIDEDMMYDIEISTGMTAVDNHFKPVDLVVQLLPRECKTFFFICSVENEPCQEGNQIFRDYERYYETLQNEAGQTDLMLRQLIHASDQFIVHRESTGLKTVLAGLPWFSDWGRDTMIALQGLTLVTGRFQDNRDILQTFAQYVNNGLVPNLFPDEGTPPMYNTVDASMWYFHSVDQYLKYTGEDEDYRFIREKIYPKLIEIIEAYKSGADFSIHMDEDGLIHAGSGLDQVTWMDVRVGEWVVTPRHGKPVEINALWYNALCVMAELAEKFGDDASNYSHLADRVKASFTSKFWNPTENCLYDVVDETDPKVRPNQIWAVSLPHTMLPEEMNIKIVNKVVNELYATYGLRSLSPKDSEYQGVYKGRLRERDGAYHQGTSWGFPLGGLITAYTKVHNHSPEAIDYARLLLEPIEDHLRDGCIGSVAEIFDGDAPNISRGCYAQAWSVGEVLRAYVEDIIPYT